MWEVLLEGTTVLVALVVPVPGSTGTVGKNKNIRKIGILPPTCTIHMFVCTYMYLRTHVDIRYQAFFEST